MQNYYALLNVKSSASEDEIKQALREQRKKCRFQTNSPNLERRQEAEKTMRLLDDAEQVLLDAGKRGSYDQQFGQAARRTPASVPTGGDIEAILREAYELAREGQVESALDLARDATRTAPGDVRGWRLLGACYEDLGEPQKAAAAFVAAIKLDQSDADLYVLLAQQLETLGNYRQALEGYERAASIEPNDLSHRVSIGYLLIKMGNTAAGLDVLEKVAASDTSNASYQWALARGYVDVAYLGWTPVGEDHPRLEAGQYATDFEQVQFAQEMVGKAMALKFDDPKMLEELQAIKTDIDSNLKRKFVGNWLLPLALGGISLFNLREAGPFFLIVSTAYVAADFVPQYIINRQLVQDKDFSEFGWIHDRFFSDRESFVQMGIGFVLMFFTFIFYAFYNLYRYQGDTIRRLVKRAAGSDTLASMVAKVQKGSQQIRDSAVSQVGAVVSHAKEQMAARRTATDNGASPAGSDGEPSSAPLPASEPRVTASPKRETPQPAPPAASGSSSANQSADVPPLTAAGTVPLQSSVAVPEGSASGDTLKATEEVAPRPAAASNAGTPPLRAVTAAIGSAVRTDAGKQAVVHAKEAAKRLVIGKLVAVGGGALVLVGVGIWGLTAMRSTSSSAPTVDVPKQVAVERKAAIASPPAPTPAIASTPAPDASTPAPDASTPAPVASTPAPVASTQAPVASAAPHMDAPPAQPISPPASNAPASSLSSQQPAAEAPARKEEIPPPAQSATSVQGQPGNSAKVAAIPASPPMPKPVPAAPRDAAGAPTAKLVTSNLAEGSACLQARKFECAVARADMVLQLDPRNQAATSLRDRALAEQRKAFESSELK
jgi:tetratricopeptide (TPR) repeat protein